MRNLLPILSLAPVLLLAAAPSQPPQPSQPSHPSQLSGTAVRNPFWPIGYEGKREVITSEVRVVPKKPEQIQKEQESVSAKVRAAAAEAAAKARAEAAEREKIVTEGHWTAAYKSLRIGGRVRASLDDGHETSSVIINGKTYGDGDLVSVTQGKNRFTWRVQRLTDGKTVRLDRVAARHLEGARTQDNSEKKDNSAKGDSK